MNNKLFFENIQEIINDYGKVVTIEAMPPPLPANPILRITFLSSVKDIPDMKSELENFLDDSKAIGVIHDYAFLSDTKREMQSICTGFLQIILNPEMEKSFLQMVSMQ